MISRSITTNVVCPVTTQTLSAVLQTLSAVLQMFEEADKKRPPVPLSAVQEADAAATPQFEVAGILNKLLLNMVCCSSG